MDNYLSQITEAVDLTDAIVITKQFKTANEFSQFIEEEATNKNQEYLETIISYCDDIGIEYESIAPLVNGSLADKIKMEAIEKNFIKRPGRLLNDYE